MEHGNKPDLPPTPPVVNVGKKRLQRGGAAVQMSMPNLMRQVSLQELQAADVSVPSGSGSGRHNITTARLSSGDKDEEQDAAVEQALLELGKVDPLAAKALVHHRSRTTQDDLGFPDTRNSNTHRGEVDAEAFQEAMLSLVAFGGSGRERKLSFEGSAPPAVPPSSRPQTSEAVSISPSATEAKTASSSRPAVGSKLSDATRNRLVSVLERHRANLAVTSKEEAADLDSLIHELLPPRSGISARHSRVSSDSAPKDASVLVAKLEVELGEVRSTIAERDNHLARILKEVRRARRETAVLNERLREWEASEEEETQRRLTKRQQQSQSVDSTDAAARGGAILDEDALRRQNARVLMLEKKIQLAEENLQTLNQTFLESPNHEVLSFLAQSLEGPEGNTEHARLSRKDSNLFGDAAALTRKKEKAKQQPVAEIARKARLNTVRDIVLTGEGGTLTADDLTTLGEALQVSTTVHSFVAERQKLADEGAYAFADLGLCDNTRLQSLTLDACDLQVKAAISMLTAVKSSKVRRLKLDRNMLGQKAVRQGEEDKLWKAICECLAESGSLRAFSFASNGVNTNGLQQICTVLDRENDALEVLDLSGNTFGERGGGIIGDLVIGSNLTSLSLLGCFLGGKGIEDLAVGLKQNTSLQTLNLRGNNMRLRGAKAISDVLRTSGAALNGPLSISTLRKLNLAGNGLGVNGCSVIAEALCVNSTVDSLDLSLNEIRDMGCKAVAKMIGRTIDYDSCHIRELYLDINEIGDDGARAMASKLGKKDCLIEAVDLSRNHIGQAGLEILLKVVRQEHSALKSLRVKGPAVDVEDLVSLRLAREKPGQ